MHVVALGPFYNGREMQVIRDFLRCSDEDMQQGLLDDALDVLDNPALLPIYEQMEDVSLLAVVAALRRARG